MSHDRGAERRTRPTMISLELAKLIATLGIIAALGVGIAFGSLAMIILSRTP